MRIILSRTDSIGDVVLTLPMVAVLKQAIPGCTVIFLCREYTRPVVELCPGVDEIVCWEPRTSLGDPLISNDRRDAETQRVLFLQKLRADTIVHVFPDRAVCRTAMRAKIPLRIATAGRFFTWLTCNRLLHIPRKNSNLHEAQLNLELLKGLGIRRKYTLDEVVGLMPHPQPLSPGRGVPPLLLKEKGPGVEVTVILHPKSKGSAREWGLGNFSRLIELLPAERYRIVITGTKEEGALITGFLEKHRGRVEDLTGKLTLTELISLIASSDALVAASTGPLHIAAMLGIKTIGLYAPMRPIFPTRWAPLGRNATALVIEKNCHECRKSMDCTCIRSITPETVVSELGAIS
ncbi:MAG TPA: glycosyltransferase family 9 protein [Bacteroidales bacterium]|nr:glycosyltransferase family 9 protein [Bacteroidales bacterium]HPS61413.1 glycosyltransferase family 9 protein [Bacteroidales bacterium]